MISVYRLNDSEKWKEIVKGFEKHDVYYLPGYAQSFHFHGDGEPVLFFFEGAEIKAVNVVMKRDIAIDINFKGKLPLNTYFDITTPYGYGGFLIEGEITNTALQSLDEEYREMCGKEGIICEFVRFHPVLQNFDGLEDIYDISLLGRTITITLDSQNGIWNNLEAKNRNVIRKARKSGIEIFWGRNPELMEKFIELYKATMDRDQAEGYYYFQKNFYDSVLNDLKHSFLLFYAVHDTEIIAMSMILYANEQVHYHLSASDKTYQHLAPTNLLLFEAACWGAENGYKTLHLGGGLGSREDGLYKFKKAFNRGSETSFSIGKKIFNADIYSELTKMRNAKKDASFTPSFFPAYRT